MSTKGQRIKQLTFDDRAKWGECPTCGAEDGQYCNADAGIQLGKKVNGERMKTGEGAHLSRLNNAPHKVKVTGI